MGVAKDGVAFRALGGPFKVLEGPLERSESCLAHSEGSLKRQGPFKVLWCPNERSGGPNSNRRVISGDMRAPLGVRGPFRALRGPSRAEAQPRGSIVYNGHFEAGKGPFGPWHLT